MNADFGFRPGDLELICSILEKEFEIEQALIFGSRAKGNYQLGSDVDIALKGKTISPKTVTKVRFFLNEEIPLPYKFDVLNYHSIQEPSLVEHINRVGIEIYHKAVEDALN